MRPIYTKSLETLLLVELALWYVGVLPLSDVGSQQQIKHPIFDMVGIYLV